MRLLIGALVLMTANLAAADSELLDYDFRRLASDEVVNLGATYEGKVVLVVNTASKCGLTRQYEGLEKLYGEYVDDGLVVLGFPSNDFMGVASLDRGLLEHREDRGQGRRRPSFLRPARQRVRHYSAVEFPQVPHRS